jgi:hypothetical protein
MPVAFHLGWTHVQALHRRHCGIVWIQQPKTWTNINHSMWAVTVVTKERHYQAYPAVVTMDGSIYGVVLVTTDPKGPTGPDLEYQTSSQHSDNPLNPHDDLTRSDYRGQPWHFKCPTIPVCSGTAKTCVIVICSASFVLTMEQQIWFARSR